MNQPKYRRPLNDKQLEILQTIYQFRFVTSPLLARLFNIRQSKAHERLQILLDQGYIGRRYETTYRLQGKAASYYLFQKGADVLSAADKDTYVPSVLKRLVKDEGRSDRFIGHWLALLEICCQLKTHYGGSLRFFTTTELIRYKYFIQPRPDMFLRLVQGPKERQFFLDYLEPAMPSFAMKGRIQQYIEYAEDEEWQDHTKFSFPTVILVCGNARHKNKLKRMAREELEDSWVEGDLSFKVCTTEEVADVLETKQKR